MKKYILIVLMVLLCLPEVLAQSTGKAKGKISDTDGEGLIGVSISIKGSVPLRGVITDVDGKFELNDVPVNSTLTLKLMGMKTQEVKFTNLGLMNITMAPDATQIEEVTVVAFGSQKKSSVVAAIQTVKVDELRTPSANLTASFAGRIPGMISYQTSGEPGQDFAQFFVRGVSTFGYKTDPLILIDDFESTTEDLGRLQVDDIESFSVLKDATATVTYGSRAANGILIIKTKQGKEGPIKISARYDQNISMPTSKPEMLNAVDYMRMYNVALLSRDPTMTEYYTEQKIQSTINGENPMVYPDVDWHSMLFKKFTSNSKANINVSGGGKTATYYVAGGYDHETGLLEVDPRNNFNNNIAINRFHLRTNIQFKVSKTMSIDARLSGRYEKYNGPATSASAIWGAVMNANAVDFPPVYLPDAATEGVTHTLFGSTLVGASMKSNPYATMVSGYSTKESNSLTAALSLNQDLGAITPNLTARLMLSANSAASSSGTRSYSPLYYTIDEYDRLTNIYTLYRLNPLAGKPVLGGVSGSVTASVQYYGEARLNWSRTFGLHDTGIMLVGIFQDNPMMGAFGSLFSTLPQRNLGLSGRFTYGFDTRYFVELSWGYNGSEKFTGKKQFGFFPSAGVGYLISNESFFQPLKSVVDNLKFRFTYGLVGNDAIAGTSGRFWFLSDIGLGGGGISFGETYTSSYGGFTINRYPNPDISWEESTKTNLGVEIGLLKGSPIKIEFDVFTDDRRKIYMQRSQIPLTAGYEAAIYGNNGRVKSKGADGSVDLQYSFNKHWWMAGRFNFTYAVNEYVLLNEPDYSSTPQWYLSRVGHNTNQALVYVAERLFLDNSEIASAPTQQFTSGVYPMPGDIKYADINMDGVINANDRIYAGYPTVPEIQYGFGLSSGFKSFDLSFFFSGNTHTSFMVSPTGIQPFVGRRNAMTVVMNNYYDPENPDIYAFWPRLSVESLANNVQTSTWWMRNGGFLRLRTIEFGYNVPKVQRINLSNVRVYGTVTNVFCISPFKLWDPEMGGSGLGYPLQRAYNFGIQFSF